MRATTSYPRRPTAAVSSASGAVPKQQSVVSSFAAVVPYDKQNMFSEALNVIKCSLAYHKYDNKQVYGLTNEDFGFFRLQQYQIIYHTHTAYQQQCKNMQRLPVFSLSRLSVLYMSVNTNIVMFLT